MTPNRAAIAAFALLALSGLTTLACSSSEPEPTSEPAPAPEKQRPTETAPTFSGTVEWILQERCQKCHHTGGIAPFPLVTYEDIKGVAEVAREKVEAREMPPWGAFDDAACKVNHKWKDDLRLSDDDVKKFSTWVTSGMPMGDPALRPPPKQFPPEGLLTKTHTLQMPKPYEVQATGGKDDIRCFPVNPGFTQDTWVGGVNVVPGDPRVVHHVIVYVDPKGDSLKKAGETGNYPCFGGPDVSNPSLLLAWAPGVPPVDYGDDVGLKIAKDATLVVQVHYHPTNVSVADQTKFEIKALPGKPTYAANVVLLGNARSATDTIKLLPGPNDPPTGPAFLIPANVADHTETMEVVMPDTIQGFPLPQLSIRTAGAHMHWAGVDMKITIDRKNPTPDQPAKECLVGTPKYDFNWQRGYEYDAPVEKLPTVGPGDKLTFQCKYDNTMGNRHVRKALSELRLASPAEIKLGEQTLDEMCLGVLVAIRRATLAD
ncbi:MAG: hypothetical protein JST00_01230 [Deltaproteobacteria bacterium]|nr:hypothetical protein [Deltaproteobacteria bacterium]